ncbi:Exosortase [Azospirillaceae bacterium]
MNDTHFDADARLWRFSWLMVCGGLSVAIGFIIASFWSDVAGAAHLWWNIHTYNYCLLITPLALTLIWINRDHLYDLIPRPALQGAAIILGAGGVWIFSTLSGVAEASQFAVVAMLQGTLLTLFGWRVYRRLWLPFSFLWLLVPSGEFLVPLLQFATAFGVGHLLELSGTPTYYENLTILVPSGSYVVAPGCSGLSFLLSALVVGVTFADMFYVNRIKKLLFVMALLALSVAGNVLRVFLIILIAHLTNNVLDIVDDHLLYGWGFFSLLLLGALWVGYRFHEPPPRRAASRPMLSGRPLATSTYALALALTVVCLAVPAAAVRTLWPDAETALPASPILSCGAFSASPINPHWVQPVQQAKADRIAAIDCERNGRTVHLVVAILDRPVRRGRLMGIERWLISREQWPQLATQLIKTRVDGREVPALSELIGRSDAHRLLWSLFWTGGDWRTPGLATGLADLRSELTGRRRAVAVVVGAEDFNGGPEAAALLQDFLSGLSLKSLVASAP